MSENNLKEVWNLALNQIEEEYRNTGKELDFKLWFKMTYLEDNIQTIKVSVPSSFMWQQMITKDIVNVVKEKIKNLMGLSDLEIEPVINESQISNIAEEPEKIIKTTSSKKTEEVIPKSEENDFTAPTSTPKNKKSKPNNSTLDENFTFETFIPGEGSSSKFAYNVSLSVADNPGIKANPVLLYGGVGLGKTHLMQAIGNRILENSDGNLKICYIQAESFLNEFTSSLLNRNSDKFKNKYRNLDVLLLDDIHFLQNKTGIQDELFYTFEALHKKKAQMIFTCDRPLKEIQNMADRLVSRLGSGMCLDLQPPNYETRKAILQKKLEIKKKDLPEEFIDYIAKTVETNIRDLESALTKVLGYVEFIDTNITIENVQQLLSNLYSSPAVGNISIENILKVVADNYNITVSDLKGKKRDQKVSTARFIAIYIAREMTEYSFTELGNEFGGRDHSSIMHAYNKINERIQTDSSYMARIKSLMNDVKKFKS
ncbi:MAG: chromosomal replication initiator protein DnaA [Treponema sp.]|nr:chromosomal replication initiator protein DnaA [Treponema sp.]